MESYPYGFNGKENDPETVGTSGGTQDYGMRIYNPSLGKFLSVDPLTSEYPELTPYQFASNRPIDGIDLDGLECMKFQLTRNDGKTKLEVLGVKVYKDNLAGEKYEISYEVEFEGAHYTFDNINDFKGFVSGNQQGYVSDEQKFAEVAVLGMIALAQMGSEAYNDVANATLTKTSGTPDYDPPIIVSKPQSQANSGVKENGVKKVYISHPEAAKHIEEAQSAGLPKGGIVVRTGIKQNRKEALQGIPTKKGYDRDEYPPAILSTGGKGSSVKYLPPSDNRGAGASMMHQLKDVPDGTYVEIVPVTTYNSGQR